MKTEALKPLIALSALAVVLAWLNTKPFRGMSQENNEPLPPEKK